jgi:hypothetical protein
MMTFIARLFRHPLVPGLAIAVGALVVYFRTLLPGIGFIDSGELVTVVHTLGIAHPTGYPLFTLVGWVFTHLPFGGEEAYRLNVMAAVFCAASLVFFYRGIRMLLTELAEELSAPAVLITPATAGGVLLLAFSRTFWEQALAVEVYSLHLLMMSLIIMLLLEARVQRSRTLWVLGAFVLGLSFTNHMTTILLVPGVLYLYGVSAGSWKGALRGLSGLLPPFLLGLSVYLYLPIRAVSSPVCNWGDPSNLERLIWHLSGKQYRSWIFSSSDVAMKHLTAFVQGLPAEFATIGLLLAVVGVIALWLRVREAAGATLLFFAVCLVYAANYDIPDIDSYYLLAYACIGVWSAAGLLVVGKWLAGMVRVPPGVLGAVMVAVGLVPCIAHYGELDESANHLVEDYTANMFTSLAPGALVFSYQWDYWVSASYYTQQVRGVRGDVLVIDKELLRRSWYLKELEQRAPGLMGKVAVEVELFRRELTKFEHGLPYESAVIDGRYAGMIRAMVTRGMEDRPVYVTGEIEEQYTSGLVRVPEGLALRVRADSVFFPTPMIEFRPRIFVRKGRLEEMIWRLYGSAYLARGDYYIQHGLAEEAKKAYIWGISMDPTSAQLRSRLSGLR